MRAIALSILISAALANPKARAEITFGSDLLLSCFISIDMALILFGL